MAWKQLLAAVLAVALIAVGMVVVLPMVGDTASQLESDDDDEESEVEVSEGETITTTLQDINEGESGTVDDAGVVVSVDSVDGDVVTISVQDVEEGELLVESVEVEVGETVDEQVESERFSKVSLSVNSVGDGGANLTVSLTENDEVIGVGEEGEVIGSMVEIAVPLLAVLGLTVILIRTIV